MADALDIVERLRDEANKHALRARPWAAITCREAADEIDRLRADLAQTMTERGRALAVGDDLEQENERLRALSVQGEPQHFSGLPFNEAKAIILAMDPDAAKGLAISLMISLSLWEKYGAAPAAPAVPPGWRWVPVEPTPEMIAAMAKAWQSAVERDDPNECVAEYRAALAAAPSAPGADTRRDERQG